MPNFFILGAAKAGTTTLYEILREHPNVFLSYVKEPQFFSNDRLYARGIENYLSTHFSGSEEFACRGEATPHYLCFDKVATRIASDIPRGNQRYIVILRDPVQRAWSLYWNMVSEGVEPLDFEQAIEGESARIKDPELCSAGSLRYRYISSGLYAQQLQSYLRYFDIRQFHFILFEELMTNPEETIGSVCRFLDLSYDVLPSLGKRSNSSNRPRSARLHRWVRQPNAIKNWLKPLLPERLRYRLTSGLIEMNRKSVKNPPLDPDTERRLRIRFANDVILLQELIGRDLRRWLPSGEAT